MSIALKGLQSLGMFRSTKKQHQRLTSKDFKERLIFSRGFFCQFYQRFYLSLSSTLPQLLFIETGTGKLEKVFILETAMQWCSAYSYPSMAEGQTC